MRLLINGIEYKADSNWSITEKVGNPTASTFKVLVEEQPIPQAGDVVTLEDDNGNALFFGLVGIPKSPKYSSPFQPRIYDLTCTNGNSILSRRIANESFANKTITEVVNQLYATYIQPEGITLGTVSEIPVPTFEIYNCKNMKLLDVLNELAGYVNGVWEVTNDKVFNFVIKEDFPTCSQVAEEGTDPFSIQQTDSERDMRTNQIVDGAFLRTDEQIENFTVGADWQGFLTSFAIIEKPRIFINGTELSPDEIGNRGINEDNTTILFFWAYDSRQVQVNQRYEGSTVLAEGDSIEIRYFGIAPIRFTVQNVEKQDEIHQRTGLSGIVDNVYTDSTIVTKADVENRAVSLLDMYGSQKHTLKLETDLTTALNAGYLKADFDLYTQWTFNLPQYGIVGDFVLTEKKTVPMVLSEEESLRLSLTFTDRNFVQSYAETISKLYFDVTKLSVRAEETVISDFLIMETTDVSEASSIGQNICLYVSHLFGYDDGQIAQPLGEVAPWLCSGGGSSWRAKFPLYAGASGMEPALIGTGIEVAC